jgi:hypothetical protein
MIGKSLRERYAPGTLSEERAVAILNGVLASQAASLVQVRAADPKMIACLVVRANDEAVRMCRALGFRITLGGTGVFGLLGSDVARLFEVPEAQRPWLEAPCGARETKVFLIAEGTALLSLLTNDGKVVVSAVS